MAEAYDCGGIGCGFQPCICSSDRELFPEAHAAIAAGIAEAIATALAAVKRDQAGSGVPVRCSCGQELGQCTECRAEWAR